MKTKKTYQSLKEIRIKIARYCAYRDRSVFETEKKLNEFNLHPEAKDHILAFLMVENFLNDERFAISYARGKFHQNKWGKRKIVEGLKQHKIMDFYIQKALSEIEEKDYKETIIKIIRKKMKEYQVKNAWELKNKIYRFLINKGYEANEFIDILENEIRTNSLT